jgi:hypothetical protein
MGYDAVHLVGETDDTHTCDEEMAGHIQTYLDAVREVAPQNSNALLLVEQKVALFGVRDDVYGTADAIVISGDNELDVFDFKYGAGVLVDVEANPQLMIYALGALLSLKDCANVKWVRLHIVQPRHHSGGHRSCAIEAGELTSKFADEVRSAAIATDDLAEPRLSAGEHCRWCLATPHCPELRERAMERTKHLFQEVDEATILQPLALVPVKATDRTPVGTLTTEELGSALAAFPLIEAWMKAVREHAYDRAAKGDVPPGFKMVQKTGNRKWTDEASAELVMEAYDVDAHEKPKLKSPAQAEKGLPNVQRERLMNQLAAKPKTGTALVPTSDKRPAVTAGDVFKEIKGESQ